MAMAKLVSDFVQPTCANCIIISMNMERPLFFILCFPLRLCELRSEG